MSYNIFKIPKRDGKFRTIEEPCYELKLRQNRLLTELESSLWISEHAHAFIQGKSIVTMAEPHINKEFVACCDIKDFFPSITAEKLVRLTPRVTYSHVDIVAYDFGDGKGRRLPQGAPTSPILSNAYLYRLDLHMETAARIRGCFYTRYADDLVFSGSTKAKMRSLLDYAKEILKDEFQLDINNKKTRIMHRSQRQIICGVVVNEKLNIPKEKRKNLRAEIYQQRENDKLRRDTIGRRAFHNMVRGVE